MFSLSYLSLVPSLSPVGVWSICMMVTSHSSEKSWSLFQLVLVWGDCCYSDMYLTVWRSVWSSQLLSVRGASSPKPTTLICQHTGIIAMFLKRYIMIGVSSSLCDINSPGLGTGALGTWNEDTISIPCLCYSQCTCVW